MTTDTKRQPLPWFAFNIGEYVKDTMRLRTESHGAYLLLMLDYYGTATPCPDDDFILAAVAKLTDEAWAMHRKVLAPFFDIRDGHWYHKRIERELEEACTKHAASIAQAQAAAAARWAKQPAEAAPEPRRRPPATAKAPKNAVGSAPSMQPAVPAAMPEQSSENAHLHKHPSLTEGGEEAPPPKAIDDQGVGTPISTTFAPVEQTIERAHDAGLTDDDIDTELRKFIGRKASDGAFSHDWQGSFAEWIEREISHRKKKAPPRIVVDTRAEPVPIKWDWWCSRYKTNQGSWSFSTCGPEPGQPGCRAPHDVLVKHGLVKEPTA